MIEAAIGVMTLLALLGVAATAALFVQACARLMRPARVLPLAARRPTVAVLIPAHDEEDGVETVVTELRRQLRDGDRLVVVADNCADATAARAARGGAEVVARVDADRPGKGFALAAGLCHLAAAPPEVVVFVDADGRLSAGGLDALARTCVAVGAPVQCLYLMLAGPSAPARLRLAEFAWRIRNAFRPEGYARLGLPCQLYGSGMALPWRLVDPAVFATGHVTEDLRIGLEYAVRGFAPRFLSEVSVVSDFPRSASGQSGQKRRWMHGHLALIAGDAPRLLELALRRRDIALFAMAADLLTPPLGLLVAFETLVFIIAAAFAALSGAFLPLVIAFSANALLWLSLLTAWSLYGRGLIGANELLALPRHLFAVIRIGFGFARGRRSAWVRAERSRLS